MIFPDKGALVSALVSQNDDVLDVGFWGQGVTVDDPNWTHALIRARAKSVYGVDLDYDDARLPSDAEQYTRQSAEEFRLGKNFDVIFAGDLIEHLSNPGRFLASSLMHLKQEGRLILTTPNCF